MRNPLATEEDAFHFVWLTIAYFAVIVLAAWLNRWLGLAAFIGESGAVAWWLSRRGETARTPKQIPAAHPVGERRILVVANETVGGAALLSELRRLSAGARTHVLVVSPALNTPLKHWVSDEDGARAAASERLEASLEAMRSAGIDARGEIGDGDPLQAIEDALRTFAPDELVISTHPEGRSNWLERGVPAAARERFALPVTHVVVDLDAGKEGVPGASHAEQSGAGTTSG